MGFSPSPVPLFSRGFYQEHASLQGILLTNCLKELGILPFPVVAAVLIDLEATGEPFVIDSQLGLPAHPAFPAPVLKFLGKLVDRKEPCWHLSPNSASQKKPKAGYLSLPSPP